MGLLADTASVFHFLADFYTALPVAVRLLVNSSFLAVLYLAILMHINR